MADEKEKHENHTDAERMLGARRITLDFGRAPHPLTRLRGRRVLRGLNLWGPDAHVGGTRRVNAFELEPAAGERPEGGSGKID